MDFNKLRYFLAIVDFDTMQEAAASMSVQQPCLSQAMRRLEKELDAELFYRTQRPLILTPAGKRFVEPAREVLRAVERARAAVQE